LQSWAKECLSRGIEAERNEEARRDIDGEHAGHEGELTAARRLV
jgi:hypothetical protein